MRFIKHYFWLSWLLLGLFVAFFGNNEEDKPKALKGGRVAKEMLELNPNEGIVYYKRKPFSGVGVGAYSNGQTAEEITYKNGKKNRFVQEVV